MNSNKTILALLLVIGVLAGVFTLQRWSATRSGQEGQIYLKQLEPLSKEAIAEIKLQKGDQSLAFKKEADRWSSGEALGDAAILNALVTDLLSPDDLTLISQNSEQHASYEVTDETATVVSLANSGGEKKIYVGAPTSGNYYVRVDGASDVWGMPSMVDQISDLTLASWLDKKLLAVDEAHINTIVIEKNGSLITLQQRDKNWFIDGGEQLLDKTTFSDLLMQLESLVALGVIDDTTLSEFPAKPTVKVTVNAQGATPTTIELYTGKDTIMAKLSDRAGNFEISQSTFDDLNLNRSELGFAPTPTQAQ